MGIIGMLLATYLSYSHNKDIIWAIIHGMFGWVYVIYYMIVIWRLNDYN